MDLTNKTVVLTGANGGLGQEIARQLAAAGARLVLVGIGSEVLNELACELGGDEIQHFALDLDLGTEEGLEALVEFCFGLPAGIDILINSAGINRFALAEQFDFSFTRQLVMVNLVAPMILTARLLPLLCSRSEALIVNIGSVLGAIGNPGYAPYCASKAGLIRYSETLRRELADSRVNVLHINPRVIRTTMNPEHVNRLNEQLGNRADEPDIVAALLIKKIGADQFGECNVGWPEKFFIKINALFPGLADKSFLKKLPLIKRAAGDRVIPPAPHEVSHSAHDATLLSRR